MPRKSKQHEVSEKKNKKNLLNTIVKNVNAKEEHIILQLPLTNSHIEKIINIDKKKDINYEPIPYERNCCYIDEDYNDIKTNVNEDNQIETPKENEDMITSSYCCYWCCHNIDYKIYGMPVRYDNITGTYLVYGTFCSLQCANAYNFSSHNGSDKVWEINGLIQMMGKKYGIDNYIRPAPSKYLLQMFNGNLTIEEFRNLHKNNQTTVVINVPPMISLPNSYETVNTSYLKKTSETF